MAFPSSFRAAPSWAMFGCCILVWASGNVSSAEPTPLRLGTKDEWLTVRNLLNLELLRLEETGAAEKNSAWVLAKVVQTGGGNAMLDGTFADSQGRPIIVGRASVAIRNVLSGSMDGSEWIAQWTRPELAEMTASSAFPFTGAGSLVGGGNVGLLHVRETAAGEKRLIDKALFIPDEWEQFVIPARDKCLEAASALRFPAEGDNEKKLIVLAHDANPLVAYAGFRSLVQARKILAAKLVGDYIAEKSGPLLSISLYTGLRCSKPSDADDLLEPMRRLIGSQTTLDGLRSIAVGVWLGDGGTGAYVERQIRDGTMPPDSKRRIAVADQIGVELHNLLVETYARVCPARDDHVLNQITGRSRHKKAE